MNPFEDAVAGKVRERKHRFGGDAFEWTFPNGYGASVIRNQYSYGGPDGLWEIAVLKGTDLCYDTPITDDVLGWRTEEQITETLREIAALPSAA